MPEVTPRSSTPRRPVAGAAHASRDGWSVPDPGAALPSRQSPAQTGAATGTFAGFSSPHHCVARLRSAHLQRRFGRRVLQGREILFPFWPPSRQVPGGFLAMTDYRDPFIQKEINAHGWMIWPPIRYSYATHNLISADAGCLAADMAFDEGPMRGGGQCRPGKPNRPFLGIGMELARHGTTRDAMSSRG